jgi:hypothetical protein
MGYRDEGTTELLQSQHSLNSQCFSFLLFLSPFFLLFFFIFLVFLLCLFLFLSTVWQSLNSGPGSTEAESNCFLSASGIARKSCTAFS